MSLAFEGHPSPPTFKNIWRDLFAKSLTRHALRVLASTDRVLTDHAKAKVSVSGASLANLRHNHLLKHLDLLLTQSFSPPAVIPDNILPQDILFRLRRSLKCIAKSDVICHCVCGLQVHTP